MALMDDMMKAVESAAAKKAGTGTVKGHLSADDLKKMKLDDLKAMAEDWGLDVSSCKTKADYVAALTAEEVEAPTEGEGVLTAEEAAALKPEDVLTVEPGTDPQEPEDHPEDHPEGHPEDHKDFTGVVTVMVTYTGMVYLRDHELRVDGLAIQGQTFKTTGTVQRDGATWYKIEDRERKQHLISANVVRCMA